MEFILSSKDGFTLLRKYRNCLMGFASLCILFFHTYCKMFADKSFWFWEDYLKQISFFGVDIFFFLSGLGLFFSIQSHSVLRFYYHRFRRLVIPVVIVGLLHYVTDDWTISHLLRNISGINFYTEVIYSFLWFVPAIATLYLIFPLYYRLFSASSNKIAFTMIILVLWFLVSLALSDKLRFDLYGFTNRIPIFCVGCLAGYLSQQRTYVFSRSVWILLILTLILGLYLGYLVIYRDMPLLVLSPDCCMPTFCIAVSISFLLPKSLDLMHNIPVLKPVEGALVRVFGFYGMISFELYCIQEWFFELVGPWLFRNIPVALKINAISFISITVLGIVLWLIQKAFWIFVTKIFSVFRKPTSVNSKDMDVSA